MVNEAVMNQKFVGEKKSLLERLFDYMDEHGMMISAGMLAMTGDTSAWKLYMEERNNH